MCCIYIWTITFSTELLFIERTILRANDRVCKFIYKLLRGRSTCNPGFLPQWPLVSNGQNISVRGERDLFYKDFTVCWTKAQQLCFVKPFLNRKVIQWWVVWPKSYIADKSNLRHWYDLFTHLCLLQMLLFKAIYIALKLHILSVHTFPRKRIYVLGAVNAMHNTVIFKVQILD